MKQRTTGVDDTDNQMSLKRTLNYGNRNVRKYQRSLY